jgi:hypothetical protein
MTTDARHRQEAQWLLRQYGQPGKHQQRDEKKNDDDRKEH